MRIRTLTTSAAAITVALGTVAAVVVTQGGAEIDAAPVAATAKKPAVSGDFNGDGYRDVASGTPQDGGGFVTVVYGGAKGLDPARRQVVANPGGTGVIGSQVLSADFDRDGYADLAARRTGAPSVIVYGGPKGLTSRTAALPAAGGWIAVGDFDGNGAPDLSSTDAEDKNVVTYMNPGAKPGGPVLSKVAPLGDYNIGLRPVAGDFNGDRRTDLLLAATNWIDGIAMNSWLELRPGTAKGLGAAKVISGGQTKGIDSAEVEAGDVNGDGRADLVARVDGESSAPHGAFTVRLATATGFAKARVFNGATSGIPGSTSAFSTLEVGDVNKDGKADIVVGAPREKDGSKREAGMVYVLFGTRSGPTTKGLQRFGQDSRGIPGTAETGDRFGGGLQLTDTNRDGRAELVVGVPGEDKGEGRLYVFDSTTKGLTTKGVKHFGPAQLGIAGKQAGLGANLLD
ncbi:VCBS repeat-containing protein [Actinomadura kijaniata]|uniref:VCBS repeat-containing protein n=1 Tax=Actinomadura kijaniata TaxID=46161 RepID=UPI003F19858F